jgi:hypothetical protein
VSGVGHDSHMAINTDTVQAMDTDLLGDLALHCQAVIDRLDSDADAEQIAELQSAVHVMDAELAERNGAPPS